MDRGPRPRSPEPAKPYEAINLGGALKEAEIEAILAAQDEWVAAGRPGALPHQEVMAELLAEDQCRSGGARQRLP